MADINSGALTQHRPLAQRPGRAAALDGDLITFVELLFFAYRDFTREADAVLGEFGLGRAHQRVLHFVNRHPALRVADLLEVLKITKQSLARVLKQLVDEGWIVQRAGHRDRRQRLLYPTNKGAALAQRLDRLQSKRVAGALKVVGDSNAAVVRGFLFAMISEEERTHVAGLLPTPPDPDGP
jgi:DNA-binding MarR family transcriptional regulator